MTKVKYYINKDFYDDFIEGKPYHIYTGRETLRIARNYIKKNYIVVDVPIKIIGHNDLAKVVKQ